MEFDEYQKKAAKYDLFEVSSDLKKVGFIEKVLGLTGEAGETADKVIQLLGAGLQLVHQAMGDLVGSIGGCQTVEGVGLPVIRLHLLQQVIDEGTVAEIRRNTASGNMG